MEKAIIENKGKCLVCFDIIESRDRHDFQMCTCGNVAVDGGRAYLRRLVREWASYEDLSVFKSEEDTIAD